MFSNILNYYSTAYPSQKLFLWVAKSLHRRSSVDFMLNISDLFICKWGKYRVYTLNKIVPSKVDTPLGLKHKPYNIKKIRCAISV